MAFTDVSNSVPKEAQHDANLKQMSSKFAPKHDDGCIIAAANLRRPSHGSLTAGAHYLRR